LIPVDPTAPNLPIKLISVGYVEGKIRGDGTHQFVMELDACGVMGGFTFAWSNCDRFEMLELIDCNANVQYLWKELPVGMTGVSFEPMKNRSSKYRYTMRGRLIGNPGDYASFRAFAIVIGE
jgi:hypothetical protein